MEPKTSEQCVLEILQRELDAMIQDFEKQKFLKKNKFHHMSELVKLAHQIRSLAPGVGMK